MTSPTIANKTARNAVMMSSCRLPSSLVVAGMPLEFRLTLDFILTEYEHLHQTVKFRSLYSVPPLRSDQQWRMGSLVFSYLTLYPRFGCKFPILMLEVLRWSICHPTLHRHTDTDSLWLTHLTMLPILTCLANSGRLWLPIRCSRKPLEHPNRLSGL